MSYHILNFNDKNEPEFWNNISKENLINCDFITPSSIIYDTENNLPPFIAKNDAYFSSISTAHQRAGLKAEKMFKLHALEQNLISEPVTQDIESMENYRKAWGYHIKRGDYTIRSHKIEIEVKCLTSYPSNKPVDEQYIYFSYYQLKCHLRVSEHTKDKVLLAVYGKENNEPIKDSLKLFCLKDLDSNKNHYEYDELKKSFKIPFSKMTKGFELLSSQVSD